MLEQRKTTAFKPAFHQWLSANAQILMRVLRIGGFALLAVTGVLLVLVLIHQGLLPLLAWFFPSLETSLYDLAVYGAYPTRKYISFNLESPRPSAVKWEDSCENGHVFVGPYGSSVTHSGPVMLDPLGGLVWMTDQYDDVMNFRMQEYRGENFLTFWYGDKHGTQGQGELVMLNSKYEIAHRVQAVGPTVKGDLHEFTLTDEGTALITIYKVTQMDLSGMGWGRSSKGWALDGLFQEVDVATGDLIFEWKASDHFKAEDSYYWQPFAGYIEYIPFDFYHINSVQKDSKGNYLISARHFHSITYIDGKSGETLWILGGDSKDFTDISNGKASDFKWQHHARWRSEEEGIISLLDNGVAGPLRVDAPYSRGMLIQVDQANRTAKLVQTYVSMGKVRATSQGNLQILPDNNHVFISWGATPAYTEFAIDGTLLCEVHLGASALFWWERMKTYRIFKVWEWIGEPEYPPSAKIESDSLYVSWNGATEVKYWELQGAKEGADGDDAFESIDIIEKRSFEEAFILPSKGDYVRYRVAALGNEKQLLHTSDPVELESSGASVFGVILGICAAVGTVVGVWYLLRLWARRRPGRKLFTWDANGKLFSREKYQYSKL